jgi:5'(3')-deoxyribonucleotidase
LDLSGREIWSEIARLLADPEIQLIGGSQKGIKQLTDHEVFVVTARRPNAEAATKQWLSTHFPCLTDYHRASTGTKHTIPSDVLVDDLDINIMKKVAPRSLKSFDFGIIMHNSHNNFLRLKL